VSPAQLQRVNFLKPALEAEFRKALGVCPRPLTNKKTVTPALHGTSIARCASATYAKSPIWEDRVTG